MNYTVFEKPGDIVKEIFLHINSLLNTKSSVSVALLGGSTITHIVDYINNSCNSFNNIVFCMGDERIVPANDKENNTHNFINELNKTVQIINIDTSLEKETMKTLYLRELTKYNVHTGFDVMILGVGEDGHTLSVFPKDLEFDLQSSEIVDFYRRKSDGQMRIGFTIPFALKAKNIYFIAVGESKTPIVDDIILHKNTDVPVGYILKKCSTAELYCDRQSGKNLEVYT